VARQSDPSAVPATQEIPGQASRGAAV
jgi:hypothetical protein